MEHWKKIEGFSKYEVSNLGNVRHIERKQNLKGRPNGKPNYLQVRLVSDFKKRQVNIFIHKLVLETFTRKRKENETVEHKDCNKHNNKLSNLMWLPREINASKGNMPYEEWLKTKEGQKYGK